ncbi:hypothetical protein [Cohnella cholangitidis]|uniref:Fibronectin type-III domain-containing protein n=1 Tax=Cohnella cholangitidis TaxID=2598458 RepID=A0A7G5C438_9BACL|nr:hypothetical protein [Cohnella cholangitidis]QMV43972.1 hypothetical protein FPL14_24450 [Cohnella cholangitidis]
MQKLSNLHITGSVYYGNVIFAAGYSASVCYSDDKTRALINGKIHSQGAESALTSDEVYLFGDHLLIGLDEPVTVDRIIIKSSAEAEMPYKLRVSYSNESLTSVMTNPSNSIVVGFVDGYDTNGETINIDLPHSITARNIFISAWTNGMTNEPGLVPWSVSEIHLYEYSNNELPDIPANIEPGFGGEDYLSMRWTWTSRNSTADIYRSESEYGTYLKVGSTSVAGEATYLDSGLRKGATYYYKLKSKNF